MLERARIAQQPRPPIVQAEFIPGNKEALARFLSREPQKDSADRFRYLLTSGLAVELITGVERFHHDTDLVIFDYRNGWWQKYLTDNVIPDKYWADMKFDPAYLEDSAWEVTFRVGESEYSVSTVHPAIIMAQKLSNAWGRTPRERDVADAKELARFWIERQRGSKRWEDAIQQAIAALPKKERPTTIGRLASYREIAKYRRTLVIGEPTYWLLRFGQQLLTHDTLPPLHIQTCQP